MASNKINSKAKGGRDDKTKTKGTPITPDKNEIVDLSLLRKPVTNCITNFAHAKKIYELASEECKELISQECDLLYECKTCRSIFRSILNFISHKRIYCKDKFTLANHGHFVRPMSLQNEIKILKELQKNIDEAEGDSESRIPLTKDLTAVVEAINTTRGIPINKQTENMQKITLQKISTTNNAVYQSINDENGDCDSMKDQVYEIESLLNQDRGVLQDDGKFIILNSTKSLPDDNVIQISDDEEEAQSLVCKICNVQFSTVKTLKFHVKYKHLESRLVYPCPDCVDIFCTSWSVYRHLYKVHRKSAAQIRRMRESIQSKAFKMNNPPAYFEKRKNNIKTANMQKLADRKKYGQLTWVENMEGDGEVPRCGGCGRMFERRAALVAHTNTCQPRNRALTRKPENKRIEIQIRKDYNKTPANVVPANIVNNCDSVVNLEEIQEINIITDTDRPVNEKSEPEKLSEENIVLENVVQEKPTQEKPIKIKATKQQSLLRSDVFDKKDNTEKDKVATKSNEPDKIIDITEEPKISMSGLVEERNFEGLRMRMLTDIKLDTLTCKKCQHVSTNIIDLAAHMARHYNWARYCCKLCNNKDYMRKCMINHINTAHKLYGDDEFYLSTIKVLEPTEAIDPIPLQKSPDDKLKPSKRKRTLHQNKNNKDKDNESPNDISSRSEENSSDMDDIEDRTKKQSLEEELLSVISSRRPVRKRAKPKNDDFEYDLSNLLKMEAQGYKDSQIITPRAPQVKKKVQSEPASPVNEPCKDHIGTLLALSKQAVERARAKVRQLTLFTSSSSRNLRTYSVFIKPPIPKLQFDKDVETISPVKETNKETKEVNKETKEVNKESNDNITMVIDENGIISDNIDPMLEEVNSEYVDIPMDTILSTDIVGNIDLEPQTSTENSEEPIKKQLPIKLTRKSFEIVSTASNKKIPDAKSATIPKVLVIKPIKRKRVSNERNSGSPIKYQAINLKNTNKDIEGLKLVKITSKPAVKPAVGNTLNEITDINNTNSVNAETITQRDDVTLDVENEI